MTDDKNRDPTFVYTVPDTVYKVPSLKAHAAQMVGLLPGLGYMLKDGTFIDMIEDAFYLRQDFENRPDEWGAPYAAATEVDQQGFSINNFPSPVGSTGEEAFCINQHTAFARNFREAESRMERSLWAPLH